MKNWGKDQINITVFCSCQSAQFVVQLSVPELSVKEASLDQPLYHIKTKRVIREQTTVVLITTPGTALALCLSPTHTNGPHNILWVAAKFWFRLQTYGASTTGLNSEQDGARDRISFRLFFPFKQPKSFCSSL